MKNSRFLAFALLGLSGALSKAVVGRQADADDVDSFHSKYIDALTASNFDSSVARGTWLVKFYSPTCGHCVRLAPVFKLLAEEHFDLQRSQNFHVAHVSCQTDYSVCEAQNLDGYPTLLLFQDGERIEEYAKERSYEELSEYIVATAARFRLFKDDVIELHGKSFKNFATHGLWFVVFTERSCPHCQTFKPKLEEIGSELRSLRKTDKLFVSTVNCDINMDLCNRLDVGKYPTMILFENGNQLKRYKGKHEADMIVLFLKDQLKALSAVSSAKEATKETDDRLTLQTEEYDAKQNMPIVPVAPVVPVMTKPGVKVPEAKRAETEQQPDIKPEIKTDQQPRISSEGNVVVLTTADFDKTIASGSWMIEFFAPWCGHCKNLAPVWDQLGKNFRGTIGVASVDCTVEVELRKRFKINGFPTIKFFYDGVEIAEFKGRRNLEELSAFAEDLSKSSFEEIVNVPALDAVKKGDSVAFLFLSSKQKPDALLQSIAKSAKFDAKFYYASQRTIFEELNLDDANDYLLVLKDEQVKIFEKNEFTDRKLIADWVNSNKYPAYLEMTRHNSITLFSRGSWIVLALLNPNLVGFEEGQVQLEAIARSTKGTPDGDVMFAWLDAVQWAQYVRSTYGVDTESLPAIVIVHPDGDEFFDVDRSGDRFAIDKTSIIANVHDAKSGDLSSKNVKGRVGGWFKSVGKLASSFFNGGLTFGSFMLITAFFLLIGYGVKKAPLFLGAENRNSKAD